LAARHSRTMRRNSRSARRTARSSRSEAVRGVAIVTPSPRSASGREAPEAFAQDFLVELADARLGYGFDEHDLVGQRPLRQLGPQVVEDLGGLQGLPPLRHPHTAP